MTKDEALNLALEALENISTALREEDVLGSDIELMLNAAAAIRVALAQPEEQPEQEPVARVIDNGTPEGATEWIPFTNRVEPLNTGDLLYATPPQPVQPKRGPVAWEQFHEHLVERNFCPRCGKRTADLTTIHTCTPPRENK